MDKVLFLQLIAPVCFLACCNAADDACELLTLCMKLLQL